jgi:hypothetical protein
MRQIGTGGTPRRRFFGISTYDGFGAPLYLQDGNYFQFLLDVSRGPEVDRRVRLYHVSIEGDYYNACDVLNRRGEVIGTRRAVLMGVTIFCFVPRRWLHVEEGRLARWFVQAKENGSVVDRHPTDGWIEGGY